MRRRTTVLAVVAALLGLAGCYPVPSIHPFYNEREVGFDENLLGLWATEDGKQILRFEDAGESAYKVAYLAEDKWSKYAVRLVRLGGESYLDVMPDKDAYQAAIEPQAFLPLVNTHTLYHVELDRNRLRISYLDDEWMKAKLVSGDAPVPYAETEDLLVLTGTTAELQSLVMMHGSDEKAFKLLGEFRRQAAR